MYSTYILYSYSTDRFYKGSTNNIRIRLNRHNAGSEKATSKGKPWKLIWTIIKETRSDAYNLELKLKNLSRKRMLKFCLKYNEGIPGDDELKLILQLSSC